MLKYVDTKVTFKEVPNKVSLCISLSGCPHRCKGCHSSYLQEDIGEPLTIDILESLIEKNKGINCICFMGGDNDIPSLITLEKWVKDNTDLLVCWYTGSVISHTAKDRLCLQNVDYYKMGPYIEALGGLDNPKTNQRFYIKGKHLHKMDANPDMFYDITDRFFRKNESTNN